MNTSTLNITIEVDDKGSVKLRQLGDESKIAGDKGEKAFTGMRGQINELKGSTDLTIGSIGELASMGFAAGIAGLAALTAGMVSTLGAASDLQETQGKFDIVFAGQLGKAEAWSAELVAGYAMSTQESKHYLAAVQDLLVPMGMLPEAAAQMSSEVVKLSADLGSFNNLPTAQVMDDIQSALVGEYDTMKKYGVVLSAATVEQEALTMGLAETTDELTAGDKAQAAYALMVEASSAAIGDMARTGDGYANQMKSFHAITEDLTAAMGQKLLPIAADVLSKINSGMRDGKGGVEGLATMITTKLLQGLGMAMETMRFFHNGWLGIKLVGTVAIDAIAQSIEFLFGGIRQLLTPLDLVFEGLVKIGAIEINPFDGVEEALGTFSASSRDVTTQVLADIDKTNAGYDNIKKTIDGYVEQVKTSATEEVTAAKTIQDEHSKTSNAIVKSIEDTTKAATGANNEQIELAKTLRDKINKETLSKYDYAVLMLENETAAMRVTAGNNEEIVKQINDYQQLKLDELMEKHGVTNTAISDGYAALQRSVTGEDGSATKLFADFGEGYTALQATSSATVLDMDTSFSALRSNVTGEGGSATAMFADMDSSFGALDSTAATSLDGIFGGFSALQSNVTGEGGSATAMFADMDAGFGALDSTATTSLEEMTGGFSTLRSEVTGDDGSATSMFDDLGAGLSHLLTGAEASTEGISFSFGDLKDDVTGSDGHTKIMFGDIEDGLVAMQDKSRAVVLDGDDSLKGQWGEFTDEAGDLFGGMVSGFINGEINSIDDAWKSMWSGMLNTASTYLGNIVAQFAASQIGSLVGKFFHTGVWELKGDEYHAVLQDGEMVVPKAEADIIRANLPEGGGFGDLAASFSRDVDPNVGLDDLGDLSDIAGYATTAALREMFGISQTPGRDFAEYGVDKTIGMVAREMSKIAGIAPEAFAPSAYQTTVANIGTSAGVAAGLGPLSGIGTFFGGVLGDLLGDALDDRNYEGLRDALEDGYMTAAEAVRFKTEADLHGVDNAGAFGGFLDAIGGFFSMVADFLGITDAIDAIRDFFDPEPAKTLVYGLFEGQYGWGPAGGGDGFGGGLDGFGGNADGGGDMGRGGFGDDGDMGMDNEGIAHTGGYLLKADEGRIIAQTGEGVLSRVGMKNLDKLNSGGDFLDGETAIAGVIADLRAEIATLRKTGMDTVRHTKKIADTLSRVTRDGMSLVTVSA